MCLIALCTFTYNIPNKGKTFWTKASGLKPNLGKTSIIPNKTNTKKTTFNIVFNLRDNGNLVFEEKLLNNQTKTTKINNIIKILIIYWVFFIYNG